MHLTFSQAVLLKHAFFSALSTLHIILYYTAGDGGNNSFVKQFLECLSMEGVISHQALLTRILQEIKEKTFQ